MTTPAPLRGAPFEGAPAAARPSRFRAGLAVRRCLASWCGGRVRDGL